MANPDGSNLVVAASIEGTNCRGCEAERTGTVLMDANPCPICGSYPWGSNEFHTCRGRKECPDCFRKPLIENVSNE
jgi:hypothetical protein